MQEVSLATHLSPLTSRHSRSRLTAGAAAAKLKGSPAFALFCRGQDHAGLVPLSVRSHTDCFATSDRLVDSVPEVRTGGHGSQAEETRAAAIDIPSQEKGLFTTSMSTTGATTSATGASTSAAGASASSQVERAVPAAGASAPASEPS